MHLTLRAKLVISFITVIIISGIVSIYVGVRLIGDGIIRQAQDKVRTDLNSAREIYMEELDEIKYVVRLTATRFFMKQSLSYGNIQLMKQELSVIRKRESLDILTVTDDQGIVLYRTRNPGVVGDDQSENNIIKNVIINKEVSASTEIVSRKELIKEGEQLARRAYFEFIPTPKAKPLLEDEITSGMMMKVAAPILNDSGKLLGVLYGGVLLNRQYQIVDKIKQTVYQGEVYEGKDIGTATIFQGDLRISTNVKREDGTRAIGTRVSEEVYDQVLLKGLPWIERAFVVNDWYITAYEPIRNISDQVIGILYVGILEKKFSDLRQTTMLYFLGLTLAGIIASVFISYFLARKILKPIRNLVFASERLARGDLTHRVNLKSKDLIGKLGDTFNYMAESLRERDEKLKERAQQTIQESGRLATIGQLAAGVAHELNNPLGGVLMYSHLLLEKFNANDSDRENLEKIVNQATRCKKIVKGLLDFARQTEPKVELSDINELLKETLVLIENQASFQNISIKKEFLSSLPKVMIDGSQFQQVFINIALNAAESMEENYEEKGELKIQTRVSKNNRFVEINFNDTGCGIPEENIKRVFEPFYTTKEVGRGTGLGLAISYGIVQRNNGTISVKSEVGKGTTFTIRLPVNEEGSG
ncbi:MAG: cache domain-containing protein [bacterium]